MGRLNGLALCAGIGGLELGVKLACPSYRTVCYVEREAFPAANLVARMEDGCLDLAPVWSDLSTFDATFLRGRLSVVTAGYPCQPFSLAGKRAGDKDDRHLWPHVARIIAECRPQIVFLENVPGHVTKGLDVVLSTLNALGFDVEWDLFSAAASGAPHRRQRLFILAYSHRAELREQERGRPGHGGASVADANSTRLETSRPGKPQTQDTLLERSSWWATEPDVGRVAHGVSYRVDRLRALGNGVVPAVAARAWRTLMERAGT